MPASRARLARSSHAPTAPDPPALRPSARATDPSVVGSWHAPRTTVYRTFTIMATSTPSDPLAGKPSTGAAARRRAGRRSATSATAPSAPRRPSSTSTPTRWHNSGARGAGCRGTGSRAALREPWPGIAGRRIGRAGQPGPMGVEDLWTGQPVWIRADRGVMRPALQASRERPHRVPNRASRRGCRGDSSRDASHLRRSCEEPPGVKRLLQGVSPPRVSLVLVPSGFTGRCRGFDGGGMRGYGGDTPGPGAADDGGPGSARRGAPAGRSGARLAAGGSER